METQHQTLKLLFFEDDDQRSSVLLKVLRKAGFNFIYESVSDQEGYSRSIERVDWDTVLYDDAKGNSKIVTTISELKAQRPNTPLIVYSTSEDEDELIEYMNQGASDYIKLNNIGRLLPVVKRELATLNLNRKLKQIEATLATYEGIKNESYRVNEFVKQVDEAIESGGKILSNLDRQVKMLHTEILKEDTSESIVQMTRATLETIQAGIHQLINIRSELHENNPQKVLEVKKAMPLVLVIEDESALRDLIAASLKREGYRVIVADSHDEILNYFTMLKENIDILLTDLVMPNVSIEKLISTARAANPNIKIVFQTGYPDTDLSQTGLKRDEIILIEKPYGQKDLIALLKAAFSK